MHRNETGTKLKAGQCKDLSCFFSLFPLSFRGKSELGHVADMLPHTFVAHSYSCSNQKLKPFFFYPISILSLPWAVSCLEWQTLELD